MSAEASPSNVEAVLNASLAAARPSDQPFRHWTVSDVFPETVLATLRSLPIAPASTHGVSGKRELHNDVRRYLDRETMARFPACAEVAAAFQSAAVVATIERVMGADLSGTFVRLEYAQDVDGFWLQPHTDLGVKRFTMLIYLDDGAVDQSDLGTDLFADADTWAKRSAFVDNTALVFVPGDDTWHGLLRRPIAGVRRSLIMNYVTAEWRARDQLAYPETPVRA